MQDNYLFTWEVFYIMKILLGIDFIHFFFLYNIYFERGNDAVTFNNYLIACISTCFLKMFRPIQMKSV